MQQAAAKHALTQLSDERHELLVLAEWEDGAFIRGNGGREAEELQERERERPSQQAWRDRHDQDHDRSGKTIKSRTMWTKINADSTDHLQDTRR